MHCCMLHNAVCWGDWDGRHVDTADYKALLWLAKGGWGGGGGGGCRYIRACQDCMTMLIKQLPPPLGPPAHCPRGKSHDGLCS